MSNVTALRGGGDGFTYEKKPDPETIAMLRDLLARAEAGEIQGIAGAATDYKAAGIWFKIGFTTFSQLGALCLVQSMLVDQVKKA